jgi:uroporphyrinogen-III synthase
MKKTLYLGIDPQFFKSDNYVIHYPVIKLVPRDIKEEIGLFTYCLLTSKNSLQFLKKHVDVKDLKCISIGPSTSLSLKEEGIKPFLECVTHTQEGMIEEIRRLSKKSSFLYPRSSRARPFLASFLEKEGYAYQILDLYDTISQKPEIKISLAEIDEIVFTSPSTVEGFFEIYPQVPEGIKVTFQGPVTEGYYETWQ